MGYKGEDQDEQKEETEFKTLDSVLSDGAAMRRVFFHKQLYAHGRAADCV